MKTFVPTCNPDCPRLGVDKVKTRGYWDVPLGRDESLDELAPPVIPIATRRKAS